MTSIIVDASNEIIMWSDGGAPVPGQGQQLVMLTDDQQAAFLVALGTPGGLSFDGKSFAALPAPAPATPVQLTVDQKLAQIGLSVALLAPAIQAVIQAVPAPPAQQDAPA
jgi:hypothetical protein